MTEETTLELIVPLEAYDVPPDDIETVPQREYLFHSEVTPLYLLCKAPYPCTHPKYPAWKASFSSLDLDVIIAKTQATAAEESDTIEHEGEIAPKSVVNRILREAAANGQPPPEHLEGEGEKRVDVDPRDAAVPAHHEPSRPPLWALAGGDLVYRVLAPLTRLHVASLQSQAVAVTVTATGGQDLGRDLHVNFGEEGALEDILSDYFKTDPPRIGASRPSYLQSVTKTLALVPPPMISVRSSALGNQKLVNVSLANRSDVAMDIRDAQVLVTAKPGKVAPDLFHVTSDPSALPITIKREESRSFVFFIEPTMVPRAAPGVDTQPQPQSDKDAKKQPTANVSYNTVFTLAWTAEPLLKTRQYLTCQYDLQPLVLSPSELSISVSVPASVFTNSRFPVSFTITNAGTKARDVSLILHQPRRSAATTKDKTPLVDSRGELLSGAVAYDAKLLMVQDELNACLVCMDETIYLGRIDPLTSKVASVDFFAFKPGAYELAMAHLYDHPTKSFLEVRCPTTCVFVLPDQTNPQR